MTATSPLRVNCSATGATPHADLAMAAGSSTSGLEVADLAMCLQLPSVVDEHGGRDRPQGNTVSASGATEVSITLGISDRTALSAPARQAIASNTSQWAAVHLDLADHRIRVDVGRQLGSHRHHQPVSVGLIAAEHRPNLDPADGRVANDRLGVEHLHTEQGGRRTGQPA
ncbi:MAG: hypothetical protein R2704_06275 [Microthrixaceae bacterium]